MPSSYPVVPSGGRDDRFSVGLLHDVVRVLLRHGYPDPRPDAADIVRLQQALFRFCYGNPAAGGGAL